MTNDQISKTFELLADLLEFQGENPFRLRAYRRAAQAIRDLPEPVESLLEKGVDLKQYDGIGQAIADKTRELIETGKIRKLEELLSQVPRSVLHLLDVPKLGPKKAAMLFHELGITNLDQLREACEQGKLRDLPGFGVKTEEAILAGIPIAQAAHDRLLWAQADQRVTVLRQHMERCDAVLQLEFAGSYRRRLETVGDLDLLVDASDPESVMDHLAQFPELESVILRGDTKMSIRLNDGLQVDLRVVPDESFGAALQYFTGSKQHNVILRGLAKKHGLKINEWGVFRIDGQSEVRIAGKTERDVYETLDLPLFPPEIREARFEFEWAERGPLPALIERKDIRGDLHMHTIATDGKATIDQMVQAAQERGLEYIAITDHSKRVTMAHGMDAERALEQWREIDRINQKLAGQLVVLKGIECDILESGEMDLPDSVLAQADWVVASIHYGQNQSREQITDRILAAIRNPHVKLIAHPTGRLINRRPAYEVDLDAVFQAAKEHQTFLELNANPRRLDLNDVHLIAARRFGIPIVINTDAHRIEGLDDMRFGINQARRGGLSPEHVLNTLSWDAFRKHL